MKKVLLSLFLLSIVFIFGCESIDLSKVSDEDLERVSEQAIKCEKPYIRFGASCCLDQNDNKICDKDEKIIEVVETPKKFLPEKCLIETGFTCISSKIESTQSTIVLQNGYGSSVIIDSIAIGDCSEDFAVTLQSEEEYTFVIDPAGCDNGEAEDMFKGSVVITFTEKRTNLQKTAYGVINTKIEPQFLPEKCTGPAGMDCIDKVTIHADATGDGYVELVVKNNLGFDIALLDVTNGAAFTPSVTSNDFGNIQNSAGSAGNIEAATSATAPGAVGAVNALAVANNNYLKIRMYSSTAITPRRFSADFTLYYRNTETGLEHPVVYNVVGRAS